jgi:hypothetical protein
LGQGQIQRQTLVLASKVYIVISLKDTFYDKAEALVGVYRDADIEYINYSLSYAFAFSIYLVFCFEADVW